jgi:hypothetical protein
VAIGKDGNPMEVSIAESDAEYDDDTSVKCNSSS